MIRLRQSLIESVCCPTVKYRLLPRLIKRSEADDTAEAVC
jgi:hypothetical protein